MILHFSPQRRDDPVTLDRLGETLTVDATAIDLSGIGEGEALSGTDLAGHWSLIGAWRAQGVLNVRLILPHGADAPAARRQPSSVVLTGDGPVTLPDGSGEA